MQQAISEVYRKDNSLVWRFLQRLATSAISLMKKEEGKK